MLRPKTNGTQIYLALIICICAFAQKQLGNLNGSFITCKHERGFPFLRYRTRLNFR